MATSAPAVADARSAASVRKALVRELRAERAELRSMPLEQLSTAMAKLAARGVKAALADPKLADVDRNGVTRLEVELVRAASELMLRAYWPGVARMWSLGAGRKARIRSVATADYDELVALYDSIHARLTREAVSNAAWRYATTTLTAARRALGARR